MIHRKRSLKSITFQSLKKLSEFQRFDSMHLRDYLGWTYYRILENVGYLLEQNFLAQPVR